MAGSEAVKAALMRGLGWSAGERISIFDRRAIERVFVRKRDFAKRGERLRAAVMERIAAPPRN